MTIPGEIDPNKFQDAVHELDQRVQRIYLHVDLDSIDASYARANNYAATGGPTPDLLLACVKDVCEQVKVVAAAITAYDPEFDDDHRTLNAARRIVRDIAHDAQR